MSICSKYGRIPLFAGVVLLLVAFSLPCASASDAGAAGGHEDDGHGHAANYDLSHNAGSKSQDNPTEICLDLALWSFVVFALLMTILWKFAWGPITEALDNREQGIADKIEEANQNAAASEKRLAEYEASIAGAAQEVRDLLDKARKEGEIQKQEILSEAQTVAADEKDRALRTIAAAKDDALGEIAQKSVDEAFALASKVIRRELQAKDHASLIQDALERFPSNN